MKQQNYTTNKQNNQINSTTILSKTNSKNKYHHLNITQRKIMENKLKHYGEKDQYGVKITYRYLANILNVNVSTISREIKRNKYRHLNQVKGITIEEYDSTYAQACADKNIKISTHKSGTKLSSESNELINLSRIIKHEFISVEYALKVYQNTLNKKFPVCQKTVYKYVHNGIMKINRKYFKYLKSSKPHKGTKNAKLIQKGDNISLRPTEIENRKVFGHWEGDTVYGQKINSKECLVTLVERKTRILISLKVKDRTASSIVEALNEIEIKLGLKNFKNIFKSITFDNGLEFSNIKEMETSILDSNQLRVKTFFANPYHSWERGTNENTNGMIRTYYPKGTNFEEVSNLNFKNVINKINSCPRKILNGLSALEAIKKENPEYESILSLLGIAYPFRNVKNYLLV